MSAAQVSVGDQVYSKDGEDPFGAVRSIHPHELTVYVEDFGEVSIPARAVTGVHDGKVIVNVSALPDDVKRAIASAHRDETL